MRARHGLLAAMGDNVTLGWENFFVAKAGAAAALTGASDATLFASTRLVQRIEAAEARALEAIVKVGGTSTWSTPVGGGVALFRAHSSPFNKVIGLGFTPLEAAELARVERGYRERRAPIQIEVATHADPALTNLLVARSYQLTGFESVLGRSLAETPSPPQERAFEDMADNPTIARWIAALDDQIVGGASMGVCDGIAQLFGAATRPAARRRGVQSALLAARLTAAHESGCDLAVVTTQPGTKSQQNVQRAGFIPLYARAIWVHALA